MAGLWIPIYIYFTSIYGAPKNLNRFLEPKACSPPTLKEKITKNYIAQYFHSDFLEGCALEGQKCDGVLFYSMDFSKGSSWKNPGTYPEIKFWAEKQAFSGCKPPVARQRNSAIVSSCQGSFRSENPRFSLPKLFPDRFYEKRPIGRKVSSF